MIRSALIFLCLALLGVFGAAQPASETQRAMTVDDGLDMVQVGTGLISPDGTWILYSKSELDWKKNKRKTTYYKVPSSGGEAIRFIGEEGGRGFQFSPRGAYLSFMRGVGKEKKENQVFVMRTDGGEAVQLTEHKKGIASFKWSDDETRILFLANEQRSKKDEERHKNGDDAIFVDEGPNGQSQGKWNNLWVLDVVGRKESRVTDEEFRIGSYDLSPEGKRVVFTARRENRRNQQNLSEIHLLDLTSGEIDRLTDNEAPESNPLWSPDGKSFVFTAPDDKNWELRSGKIWLMDVESRRLRLLSQGFQGNIRNSVWANDGKSLLFTAQERTDTNLYRLQVSSGALEKLTDVRGTLSVSSFSRDRNQYVYTFTDFDTPGDLFAARLLGKKAVRLTDANPWVLRDLKLAESRLVGWKSRDGLEIEGILDLPWGHKEGVRLPLILHVHGGPAGVFSNRFRSRAHIYAGLGYASLSPNVRGSRAYGDDFLRGNMNDIGGGDYQDLMTGVDSLIDSGLADPDKMGIRGWSYGGILGGWTLTQTNRFKAASLGAMVSDWTSEYGPGFNYDVRLWYIGGTPWDNPDAFRRKSALTHVANVKTPTLLLHGIKDRTDTEAQSMMFFAALKDLGNQVRYIRFPREPHGFREPRHQRVRDIEEIRWMQKHVLGLEWEAWKRIEEKKEEEEDESDKEPTA